MNGANEALPWHRRQVATIGALAARFSGVRASAVYGLSGAAFAGGNLLLARAMPVEDFGRLALAIALFNICAVIAPLGVDQVVLRHRIAMTPRLIMLLVVAGALIGSAVAGGAFGLDAMPPGEAALLAVAILAGGMIFVIGARLRAAMREFDALLMATAASWILLAIGGLGLLVPMPDALLPLALFAAGNVATAILGCIALQREAPSRAAIALPWREAMSLLSIVAIGAIAVQLERLLVPVVLSVADLALFSVLASVALFPFRMASSGAGFGLIPKLRASTNRQARRAMVRDEVLSVGALLAGATVCVVIAAPMVAFWLTGGRYEISLALVLSACLNGGAKVVQAIPRAILIGCGSERDMVLLSRLGWLGLGAGVGFAFLGARWGLEGVLCAIALGSLTGSIPAALIAARRMEN